LHRKVSKLDHPVGTDTGNITHLTLTHFKCQQIYIRCLILEH